MKQKAVSMLLIAALAAGMLTGCGNEASSGGEGTKTPGSGAKQETKTRKQEKVTCRGTEQISRS